VSQGLRRSPTGHFDRTLKLHAHHHDARRY
jgi:hypothetical protein